MRFPVDGSRPVILFDLDGTLLPVDRQVFERSYFQSLCAFFPEFEPQSLVRYIWAGTNAMTGNDGSRTNREAFAAAFSAASGVDYYANEARFLRYYETSFHDCAAVCRISGLSREIVDTLQEKGYRLAVATDPLFPRIATEARLGWLGLEPSRFPLVTHFENSRFAKPNPLYYRDVCDALGVRPEDCVMIGNDVVRDGAARSLGMQVLLADDFLINEDGLSTDGFPMGPFSDLLAWARALPRR